jgi:3-hydroxymyristoyl/3-hydroxydecanoyl-(acyl carrier protein) dehydratase
MTTEPIVLEEHVTPPEAVLLLSIPSDLEYLVGHFPSSPIVPGVVQLKWAIESARRLLGVPGEVMRMEALKFQLVMSPGAVATLTLKWVAAESKLHFVYASGKARFSSGRLSFRAAS